MTVEENSYDDEKLANIREKQDDPIVVYVIVRKSLSMGVGKIAAQVHHVGKMLVLGYNKLKIQRSLSKEEFELLSITENYFAESFRTVVLVADDKQWEKIKEQVRVFVVRDAGLTEVEFGSETVMSTWPMLRSCVPKIIKKLQVLKAARSAHEDTDETTMIVEGKQ